MRFFKSRPSRLRDLFARRDVEVDNLDREAVVPAEPVERVETVPVERVETSPFGRREEEIHALRRDILAPAAPDEQVDTVPIETSHFERVERVSSADMSPLERVGAVPVERVGVPVERVERIGAVPVERVEPSPFERVGLARERINPLPNERTFVVRERATSGWVFAFVSLLILAGVGFMSLTDLSSKLSRTESAMLELRQKIAADQRVAASLAGTQTPVPVANQSVSPPVPEENEVLSQEDIYKRSMQPSRNPQVADMPPPAAATAPVFGPQPAPSTAPVYGPQPAPLAAKPIEATY